MVVNFLRKNANTSAATTSTTARMISTTSSWVAPIATDVVVSAAIVTKTPTPNTQNAIARIDAASSGLWLTLEFTIDVMTSPTTPSGCTTVSGENVRLS